MSDPVNHPSHYTQGRFEDLKKARWYLDRIIEGLERANGSPQEPES